jgi:hypothetical protein
MALTESGHPVVEWFQGPPKSGKAEGRVAGSPLLAFSSRRSILPIPSKRQPTALLTDLP